MLLEANIMFTLSRQRRDLYISGWCLMFCAIVHGLRKLFVLHTLRCTQAVRKLKKIYILI